MSPKREGTILYLAQDRRSRAEKRAKLLSLVDIFEPLSREEIAELERGHQNTRLEAGAVLYAPTDPCETLFVLEKGRVRVYKKTSEGREFTLAVLEGGTVFGEMVLAGRRSRESYAECVEETEISILDRGELERLVLENPRVGLRLSRLLSERVSEYEKRMGDLGLKDVPDRLANLILMLIENEGVRTRGGYKIPTRYTHQRLGTMIGANREAVTRAFSRLRKAGAVETENRRIIVEDPKRLRRAASG